MEPEPFNQTTLNLDEDTEERVTNVWQRGGRLGDRAIMQGDGRAGDILSKEFLRKYIFYAKNKPQSPKLSEEAMENISTAYDNMRAKQTKQNLPITARSLETIIRLSTAHAKARLSDNVENEDVECAVELMHFVLFHEIGAAEGTSSSSKNKKKQSSPTSMGATSNDDNDNDEDDDDFDNDKEEYKVPSQKRRHETSQENESPEENAIKRQKNARVLIEKEGERLRKSDEYRRLMSIINKMSSTESTEELQIVNVVDNYMKVARSSSSSLSQSVDVTPPVIEAMLYMLEEDNKIMVQGDTINIV
jgi:DNA replication licensing factor MCM3